MDEEHKEFSAPPRAGHKLFKIMTLSLLFLALFSFAGFFGLKATSSSEFCSSCHEMKPEYYTLQASAHSQVECIACHTDSGAKKVAKDQAKDIAMALRKINVDQNMAPIRMPKEIPDSSCEKCHDVFKRNFTVSGDIIIPHDKHKEEDVKCIQCHSGVAHGKIADREMTFKTDYDKWDRDLGVNAMADYKWTRPSMDTCIDCHESRKVTTECTACHTSGMVPTSHNEADFKTKNHGLQAKAELKSCNSCHKFMSTVKLEGYEEASALAKYFNTENTDSNKNANSYAKENTYCLECHKTRPASHTDSFFNSHGTAANKNNEKCFTCHENDKTGTAGNNKVNCSSCHQMKHMKNWRDKHPVPVNNATKPQESCYKCHVKKTCSNCHKGLREKDGQ